MAEKRDHPTITKSAPSPSPTATLPPNSGQNLKLPNPQPATYVVQVPREQVLRYPPPENARKLQQLTRRKNRRSCCCRCCCFVFCLLLLLIIAAAVSAGVMYFVFRFRAPKYTMTKISIKGMNLTSSAPLSPAFNVSIRAENPNGKVGIYYLENSAVEISYNDVLLSYGALPAFYQPKKNVTVLHTSLRGSDVVFGAAVKRALGDAQRQARIPLMVEVEAPVKIQVGSVRTWEITFKVKCDVVLDALNERAKIISKDCDFSVRLC